MKWSIGCIKQLALGLWLYVCNFIWDQRRLHRRNTWAWEIGILTLSKLYCYTSHWANAPDSSAIWMALWLGLFGLQEHMGTMWEGNLLGNQWGWGPWNGFVCMVRWPNGRSEPFGYNIGWSSWFMIMVEHIFGTIYWFTFGWVLVRSNEVLSLGGITRKNVLGARFGTTWLHVCLCVGKKVGVKRRFFMSLEWVVATQPIPNSDP